MTISNRYYKMYPTRFYQALRYCWYHFPIILRTAKLFGHFVCQYSQCPLNFMQVSMWMTDFLSHPEGVLHIVWGQVVAVVPGTSPSPSSQLTLSSPPLQGNSYFTYVYSWKYCLLCFTGSHTEIRNTFLKSFHWGPVLSLLLPKVFDGVRNMCELVIQNQ